MSHIHLICKYFKDQNIKMMKKSTFVFFVLYLFFLQSCQKIPKFNKQKAEDLLLITKYLKNEKFKGTFVVKSNEFKFSNKKLFIPNKYISILNKYKILGVTQDVNFTFFVIEGWKGNNYGFLNTTKTKDKLSKFRIYKTFTISIENESKWYYVSSKLY